MKAKTEALARQLYNLLPTTATVEDFAKGHGNWSLTERDYALAKALTAFITNKETA